MEWGLEMEVIVERGKRLMNAPADHAIHEQFENSLGHEFPSA